MKRRKEEVTVRLRSIVPNRPTAHGLLRSPGVPLLRCGKTTSFWTVTLLGARYWPSTFNQPIYSSEHTAPTTLCFVLSSGRRPFRNGVAGNNFTFENMMSSIVLPSIPPSFVGPASFVRIEFCPVSACSGQPLPCQRRFTSPYL